MKKLNKKLKRLKKITKKVTKLIGRLFIIAYLCGNININEMKQRVYLAGGFKSEWANTVKQIGDNFHWINPKEKEYKNGERITMNVDEYGKWDLHYIKQSDIVFVYVEKTNTSCIGLSVEAGYAKGLGKTVILVLEPNHETIKDAYLSFITQVADIVFEDLDSGINYLKSFSI